MCNIANMCCWIDEVKKSTILVTLGYIPPPDLAKNLKLVHLFSAGVDWVYQSPLVSIIFTVSYVSFSAEMKSSYLSHLFELKYYPYINLC
jgi:hypothetical protein